MLIGAGVFVGAETGGGKVGKMTIAVGGTLVGRGMTVCCVATSDPNGSGVGALLVVWGVREGSSVKALSAVNVTSADSLPPDRLHAASIRTISSKNALWKNIRAIGIPLLV